MKKSKSVKSIISIVLNASLILSLGAAGVQAAVKTESIPGNVYTFGEKNPYDITAVHTDFRRRSIYQHCKLCVSESAR